MKVSLFTTAYILNHLFRTLLRTFNPVYPIPIIISFWFKQVHTKTLTYTHLIQGNWQQFQLQKYIKYTPLNQRRVFFFP